MNLRFFAGIAFFLVSILFVAVLMVTEQTPQIVESVEEEGAVDRYLNVRWTPGDRDKNLVAFGLDSATAGEVGTRIAALYEQKDVVQGLAQVMKSTPQVARDFCRNTGFPPSRYTAIDLILSTRSQGLYRVRRLSSVAADFSLQGNFPTGQMQTLYRATEMSTDATSQAFAMNVVSAIGDDVPDRLDEKGKWTRGITTMQLANAIENHPGTGDGLLDFFALMFLVHEVANDPSWQVCAATESP